MVYNLVPHMWVDLLPAVDEDEVDVWDELDELDEVDDWEEDDDWELM